MKKVLAILLAVILVLTLSSGTAVLVFASEDPTIVVSSVTAKKGETKSITISLENNPGIASMKVKVAYPAGLSLVKLGYDEDAECDIWATFNITEKNGQATQPQKPNSPVALNWVSPFANVKGDVTFATLTFKVADDATEGEKPITITYNPKDVYNKAETNITFAVVNGGINVVDCLHENTTQVPAVASTCKVAGHGAYIKCNDCNKVIEGSDAALPLDSSNHVNTTNVPAVASTCDVAGHGAYTKCNDCGSIIAGSDAALPFNHANTVNVPAVASTCKVAGHGAYTKCNDCGRVIEGSDAALPLDSSNHVNTVDVPAVASTCKVAGHGAYTKCNDCGNIIAGSDATLPLDSSNHVNTTKVAAVASTCKTAGHGAYTKCDDCGNIIEGSDAALPLDSSNHEGDTEVRNAKAASCTEKGYTGDTYCLGCGAKIADGKDIDMIDHTPGEWITDSQCHWKECTVCHTVIGGESEPHDFEEKIIKEATTEAEGQKGKVCKVCGYVDEESLVTIPKLISYDVDQTEGNKEDKTAVYDAADSKAVAYTAKFAKTKLTAVKVNGVEVSSDNYDVTADADGNAVVTLKESYLKTLGNGNYTLTMVADDGIAQSAFTVKNNAAAADNNTAAAATGEKSVKTGDMDIALLIIALLAVMGASIFAGVSYKRKNESK